MRLTEVLKKSFLEGYGSVNIDFATVVMCMIITVLMAVYIFMIYRMMNRRAFYNRNFNLSLIALAVITAAIILTIQSNIVISLGMVGALSIVRFRTAVKDPLDLLYLFWAITTGITAGAGMYLIMALSGLIMVLMIAVFSRRQLSGRIFVAIIHCTENCEEKVLQSFGRSRYQLKSRTIRGGKVELAVEVFCKKDTPALGYAIDQIDGVEDVTLIQYNGEYHG